MFAVNRLAHAPAPSSALPRKEGLNILGQGRKAPGKINTIKRVSLLNSSGNPDPEFFTRLLDKSFGEAVFINMDVDIIQI